MSTNVWNDLSQKLQSTNTSELLVTPFPISSLDCVSKCQCGIVHKRDDQGASGRIFGGSEAEVENYCFFVEQAPPQERAYPWIAALLRDEDIDSHYINSKCGAVLVSTFLQYEF